MFQIRHLPMYKIICRRCRLADIGANYGDFENKPREKSLTLSKIYYIKYPPKTLSTTKIKFQQ